MKYMGNKDRMMPVLSQIISFYGSTSNIIADPFCGSAAVSWFLAESTQKKIVAGDIQRYAVARASAVVARDQPLDPKIIVESWFPKAMKIVNEVASHFPNSLKSIEPELRDATKIEEIVSHSRKFCTEVLPVVFKGYGGSWPISKAYGGYYFSPVQALVFDALRQTVPEIPWIRDICLSSLVEVASRSAASPGHTAQPFQPTLSSAKYIIEAWTRDPWVQLSKVVTHISARFANVVGETSVGDFSSTLSLLEPGDLVFADPPYSGVHYSRFYHVLETITNGTEFSPEGRGRYPAIQHRPSSQFSKKSEALTAASQLLSTCANRSLPLILTFPTTGASNGLTVKDFVELGRPIFTKIHVEEVQTDFSTLGGNKKHRAARKLTGESIVAFVP